MKPSLPPSGFALLLVISILILLSMLAASFNAHMQVEVRSAGWLSEKVRLHAAAHAGILRAIIGINAKDEAERWLSDGRTYLFNWQQKQVRIKIQNESSKVDINFAPRELIVGLFEQLLPGQDSNTLADSLADWVDANKVPLAQGAEADAYKSAGLPQSPTNNPLNSLEELTQIMHYNQQILETLRPHITVYSRQPKVDVASASLEVITALPGIDHNLAAQFVALRAQAREQNQPIDTSLLHDAQRYISNNSKSRTLAINIEINNSYGQAHKEQAIIRLLPAQGGYRILSRHD